jgi:hypothetical protein
MKLTIFTLAILTLFVGVTADSYQNGFITGMVVGKAMPSKKVKIIKYNTVNIDTSLFDFPPQKTPICRPIQVKELKYRKLHIITKIIVFIIAGIILSMVCNACSKDPDFADFMLGYMVGQMVESMFSDD